MRKSVTKDFLDVLLSPILMFSSCCPDTIQKSVPLMNSVKTEDLLLDLTILRQTGFISQLQNVESLENKGWEFLVNSTNIRNANFNWSSTLTLSSYKNKVLDIGGQEFIDVVVDQVAGAGNLPIIVGETVPVFTGVRYLGTWKSQEEIDASGLNPGSQVVGGPRFEDLNEDGIISTQDNVVFGNPFPDLIFGFENTLTYKNFDFNYYVKNPPALQMVMF